MLNNLLNDLQLYKTKYFNGLVEQNMLSQALVTQPYNVSTVLSYVFGAREYQSTLNYLGMAGKTLVVENNLYQWPLMIEHEKPATIVQAKWQGSDITSTDTPGINGTPIQIWTSDRVFATGAIIEFDDNEFQARIMGEPYQDGSEFVYTVQIANGKSNSYILPTLLEAGRQISRAGSAYEEGSDEADIIGYQTPFMFRNHLTTMRMKYDITGSAYSDVMVLKLRDPKTKKSTFYWAEWQEWLAYREWFKRIDYQLVYEQYSTNTADGTNSLKGTNGRPIYRGAGLMQQISPSNKRSYTKLTADILEEFLFDLSYNIRGMGDRKFVALTGEMGMKELDRILREKASALGLTIISGGQFITGSGQNLELGGQFTTYKMLNGIELILKHFPLFDDTYHFRKLHPVTGKPVESYKMLFLDLNMIDGEPNIQLVVKKGREMVTWSNAGAVAPGQGFGFNISTVRSHGKDLYTVYFLTERGIMLRNPLSCGMLYLDTELV